MGFGAIIIGDEILSGKRSDKHFAEVVRLLGVRGLALDWSYYLGDDRTRLSEILRRTFAGEDVVFSFGGIGITPDDHTRQAAAAALGIGLALHADAEREIRARFGDQTTPQRLRLGEFPQGSEIIANPYNGIPGFALRRHYFFPGFPVMAWPMLEWVLDNRYAHLQHAKAHAEQSILVYGSYESALLDLMERIVAATPDATLFSLPSIGEGGARRHLELGLRGDPDAVARAMAEIRAEVARRGLEWEEKT